MSKNNGERAYAPHCNAAILHAPGVCEFCDEYNDWQAQRIAIGVPFDAPDASPWPGNRPEGYPEFHLTDEQFQVVASSVNRQGATPTGAWVDESIAFHNAAWTNPKRKWTTYFDADGFREVGFRIARIPSWEISFNLGRFAFGICREEV